MTLAEHAPQTETHGRLPLSGVRVLDATHQLAGPQLTRLLGDLGAEVIKIESVQHADTARLMGAILPGDGPNYERCSNWNWVNQNKRGLTLNLKDQRGLAIFKTLAEQADVVAENFRPGAWDALGLGYEALRKVNEGIILVSISGYGATGPWRLHPSFAGPWEQATGFSYFSGYPGGEPLTRVVWEDSANGMMGAFAVLMALWHRRRTGKGQFIDLSAIESITCMNAEALLDFQINGRTWERIGNQHRFGKAAPHGCFRCQGEEAWLAVAVRSEAEWDAFCKTLNAPEWRSDARFATREGRLLNEAVLSSLIEERTKTMDRWELMHQLQGVGVPASAVASGWDVIEQARHGKPLAPTMEVDRDYVGRRISAGLPFRMSRTPPVVSRPAPTLGEHNHELVESVGIDGATISELERDQVIGNEALNL